MFISLSVVANERALADSPGYGLEYIYGTPSAPPLSLSDLSGKTTNLSDLRGKVVVLNFWATWCPPCIKELPALSELQQQFDTGKVNVLGVNLGEQPRAVQQFVNDFEPPIAFKILLAPVPEDIAGWDIKALPQSYIINKSNQLEYSAIGPRDFAHPEMVRQIQKLVDRPE